MITLASDFGSPYPAAMKGVLLSRADARLVDIAHDFPRQDVRQAAFWLREILPYFPPAVHLVVVDPGVGTARDVLVATAGDHVFVAPDNGVVVPVAERMDADPSYYVSSPDDPASATFHGRDVFAPLAADIHEHGLEAILEREDFRPAETVARVEFPAPEIRDRSVEATILVVDDFGNAVTNVPGEFIADAMGETVSVDGEQVPVRRTYAALDPGSRLVTVGSHGNVELAVNRGRGADAFGVSVDETVQMEKSG